MSRIPYGVRIDLGGIAKGWIAEHAAHRLEKFTSTCAVNAGGDMFLIGTPAGRENWEVGLEDPRQPESDLMTLLVENGAVATSSVAKRIWQQGEVSRHHLIDPRSGEPAVSPWLSVTVFGPGTATAEVFAKAILIGGPEIARSLIEKNPQISYLAVDKRGEMFVPEHGKSMLLQTPI